MSSNSSQLPAYDPTASVKYTAPPNPSWKYGDSVDTTPEGKAWMEGEKEGWKQVDPATEEIGPLYQLLISGIVPRPVAFVSSISDDGVENLAPFSWFNQVSASPAVISISCSNGPERVKDTTNNIKSGNGFTVNVISEPWIEQANAASINAPPGIGEWAASGLTQAPSTHVKAARVKESAFSMECELFQAIDIVHPVTKVATTTLILGLIKQIHVRKDVLNERGIIDLTKYKPIARMGDVTYAKVGDAFRLPRPFWKDEEKKIEAALKEKASGSAGL